MSKVQIDHELIALAATRGAAPGRLSNTSITRTGKVVPYVVEHVQIAYLNEPVIVIVNISRIHDAVSVYIIRSHASICGTASASICGPTICIGVVTGCRQNKEKCCQDNEAGNPADY